MAENQLTLLRLFSPETTSKTTDPSPNGHPAKRAPVLGRMTKTASILQHILDQKIQRKSQFQVSSSTLCQIKIACILILFQCIITVYIFCVYLYVLLTTSYYFFFLASVKDLNCYFKCFTLLVILLVYYGRRRRSLEVVNPLWLWSGDHKTVDKEMITSWFLWSHRPDLALKFVGTVGTKIKKRAGVSKHKQ